MSLSWSRRSSRAAIAFVLALVSVVAVLSGCGGSSSGSSAKLTGDGYPGLDTSNTRHATGSIKRSNAKQLEVAWTLPSTAKSSYGSYASSPVVAGNVVYMQDLESNVEAINLESGEVIWKKTYNDPDQGPNGVVVAEGKVFGANSTEAFALDQETGKQLWAVPLTNTSGESIDMAPGYREGLVYVSTVPTNVNSTYPAEGVGVLWALDAKTGKKVWHFNTVPPDLWGKKSVNSGGGLWYAPSFDQKGSMYFGVGNPAPYPGASGEPWGSSRPGPDLYTDSMVKLDAKTGKMKWYYQQTPHDIYDWDFQDPPILAKAGGEQLAIGAGKSGIVVALNAETGKPVWKTPVGKHTGHDNDGLYAMRGEYSKLRAGSTVYPGTLGGAIAPMAANETTVFVPVVNHPIAASKSGEEVQEGSVLSGELDAIDIKTGKLIWSREFSGAAFGAPVAVNDMVFVTSFDGTVHGLDATTGGEVWQASLPAGSNTAVTVSGDTLLVPAGIPTAEGQTPELVAYRLGG